MEKICRTHEMNIPLQYQAFSSTQFKTVYVEFVAFYFFVASIYESNAEIRLNLIAIQ